MGWAALLALGLLFLLLLLVVIIASKLAQLRHTTLEWTDERVSLMDEVIAGMQMVKVGAGALLGGRRCFERWVLWCSAACCG